MTAGVDMESVLDEFGTDVTTGDGSTIRVVLDRQYHEVLKITGERILGTVTSAVASTLSYLQTLTTAAGEHLSVRSIRPADAGMAVLVLAIGGCGLSEDTTFQPHDARVACSNMHQTILGSLETHGEITQWIRFWDHPSPLVGVAVTVWATREGAVGSQPIALIRNVILGIWDADSPGLREALADWPGLLGWYGTNIDPTEQVPFTGIIRFSESPIHGATVTPCDENGNPDPEGEFVMYTGIDEDIAGYELTATIQAIPEDWPGCVWSYEP